MYGVFDQNEDSIYVMSADEVWKFLSDNCAIFQNYSVHTDGNRVVISESSAGPNGKLDDVTLDEFYYGFEDEGYIIRKISPVSTESA